MESSNKKVLNATPTDFDDIHFKSKLECAIYKALKEQEEVVGLSYEPTTFCCLEGFYPTVPFYIRDKKTKRLIPNKKKIISITYTPDLVFYYKEKYVVYVEVKPQFENDVFYLKKKLFRKFLEECTEGDLAKYEPIYAQISCKREVVELMEILKQYV